MTKEQTMKWNLDNLYPDFTCKEFIQDYKLLDEKINGFIEWSEKNLNDTLQPISTLEQYVQLDTSLALLSGRLEAFASLRFSADSRDTEAKKYDGLLEQKLSNLTGAYVRFAKWLSGLAHLDAIIGESELLTEHRFHLMEIVSQGKYMLSEKEEIVLSKMKLTSSSAWAKYKNLITADHMVDIELDGKAQQIGINKVKNMYFSTDGELRRKAFEAELVSNEKIAEGVAAALNGIKGEVLTICQLKGYESPLQKTLIDSRMDQATLDTMLKVMKDNLHEFTSYFKKKAELLGHTGKLPYYDVMAPVGKKEMNFTYLEASDFIEKHFRSFTPQFGDLARTAFEQRWIDAEVRDGKRGGAFCHNLRSIGESRVLCSFDGNFKNVCTLAHELGHAYHGKVLSGESVLNTHYPMPLAETASIFAENIVRNAAIEIADREEAMVILGAELVNCCSVIVDIYARFLFESELFQKRKNGDVPLEEIKELMLWAQKQAYGEGVDESTFDPFAWMHKPHYYYAERNFYNFPYAFGLLFSKGLYHMYKKEGSSFVEKYNEVLRLTGKATVYEVAAFAGIDLHDEEFWKGSMEIIKSDIKAFCNA